MDDETQRFADGVVLAVIISIGFWALVYSIVSFIAPDIAAWISGQPPVMVR